MVTPTMVSKGVNVAPAVVTKCCDKGHWTESEQRTLTTHH